MIIINNNENYRKQQKNKRGFPRFLDRTLMQPVQNHDISIGYGRFYGLHNMLLSFESLEER